MSIPQGIDPADGLDDRDLNALLFAVACERFPDPAPLLEGVSLSAQSRYWLLFRRTDHHGVRVYSERPLTGKYLFFAADPAELLEVIRGEFERGLIVAKISADPSPVTGDFCLCLYDSGPDRVDQLARRGYSASYRRWKSTDATRAGRYSRTYLSGLPEDHPTRRLAERLQRDAA